ncbi:MULTISPECIES: CshA/CshB family fibrillar adhesin-related protein [unclassified Lysobacter]|uniref:CshA/CshB family fibrillar adhesin-related protein n=1 Tax=unclassified Lysobacter TaxID=2635362 RepID=UPI001BEB872C|nr:MULTISPECIES: CshA/CshB family fibrillar adhesin-related protein [unclassified Lysobacter]MBT2745265.1 DUF11 domain-containing protein [Lysobacter sp. ISL-42]MBT2751862.1 DUF11 domain-containing protein [Lysobacter sp. ISL-50]MBT2777827.1 DUF11 domain-containing protein [Lysobacter sp. ISL-54]MBT2783083.1 DUF11 domain-containing protein [Lysobacter sp. ISL-52]
MTAIDQTFLPLHGDAVDEGRGRRRGRRGRVIAAGHRWISEKAGFGPLFFCAAFLARSRAGRAWTGPVSGMSGFSRRSRYRKEHIRSSADRTVSGGEAMSQNRSQPSSVEARTQGGNREASWADRGHGESGGTRAPDEVPFIRSALPAPQPAQACRSFARRGVQGIGGISRSLAFAVVASSDRWRRGCQLLAAGKSGFAAALLSLCVALSPSMASAAAWATGGSSPYRSQILWLTWGDPSGTTTGNGTLGAPLANGNRSIANVTVNGVPLAVTCTLNNITTLVGAPGIWAWGSGQWGGDLLDNLYNIGGTGTANQLINGIDIGGAVKTFTITCSATLNGAPYDIPGLIMADGEQAGFSPQEPAPNNTEYVQGTADGVWHVAERMRVNCNQGYTATLSADSQTLRLAGPNSAACVGGGAAGPMATAFLRFNPSAYSGANRQVVTNWRLNAGGGSIIAIGLVIPVDGGDAPSIYGTAAHMLNPTYSADSLAPGASVDVFGAGFTLSVPSNANPQMLGATVDNDATVVNTTTVITPAGNVAASVDNTTGQTPDDEAAFATLPAIEGTATSYSLTVPLGATAASGGQVCGWIDLDRGGSFGDNTAEEACATFAAGAASAVLNWTLPTGNDYVAGNSYARLRIGRDAAPVGSPTGLANIGEVEDYPIELRPRLRLDKVTVPVTDGGVFNLTINPAPTAAFTANNQGNGGTTGLHSVPLGGAVTLSETAGTATNLAAYTGNMTCTNRASGAVYGPTAGTSHSYTTMTSASTNAAASTTPATTANVNDTEITCVLTNSLQADLAITKTNTPAIGPLDQPDDTVTTGDATTYTLVVTNHGLMPVTGAVVRDTPVAGITCPPGNAVTITGNGVPAGSFTVADLIGANGIVLGALAAGQSTNLSFTCQVN